MTDVYYNFDGTTIDANEIAAQIKTELRKADPKPVADTISDKFTVRTVARVVDSAFAEFLEDVEYRLSIALGVEVELDLTRFENSFEEVCDVVESEVARNEESEDEDEEELAPYVYSSYDPEWDEEDEDFDDSEDYDFENPRY